MAAITSRRAPLGQAGEEILDEVDADAAQDREQPAVGRPIVFAKHWDIADRAFAFDALAKWPPRTPLDQGDRS
jgi:hypothetical protein